MQPTGAKPEKKGEWVDLSFYVPSEVFEQDGKLQPRVAQVG